MIYEEALKTLDETVIGNLELKIVISKALEKQISKKPIRDLRKGIKCYCPICNSYVGYYGNDNTQNNYCSDCGQAIWWGKEDE